MISVIIQKENGSKQARAVVFEEHFWVTMFQKRPVHDHDHYQPMKKAATSLSGNSR